MISTMREFHDGMHIDRADVRDRTYPGRDTG
jgi:hypothetical protein